MTIPQLNKTVQDWKRPTYVQKNEAPRRHSSSDWNGFSKKPKDKKIFKKILGFLIPLVICLSLLGGIFAMAMLAWVSKDLPSPDGIINRTVTLSTKIYDRTGNTVLYDIHGDVKRTLINLTDMPKNSINATLTAEDRNFYTHNGISLTGIARSIILNIFTGSKVGGSTLTQQFVKNAILTNEKTYIRKIKEILISYQLEKKYTKDQILQMYFNEIPYGSVIYGIEAASQTFFGKSAKDLSLAQSAILAAIPQMPTYYSPYGTHLDALMTRQRWVLDSMVELGYVTKDQAEVAKQEKIIFRPSSESMIAPHFVMYIKDLLAQKYGDDFLNQEGLKVITTIDLDKQKMAEDAVTAGVEKNGAKYQFTNASLVALDPKTGQILAMVGSVDYFNEKIDGQVNVSLRNRQPGSSFKPIVYTASFIKGYTPDTVVYDVNTNFDTTGATPYQPQDYDLKERGPITFRKALAGSLNIPAVKATYLTGLDNILNLADKLGYTTLSDRKRFGLSIVLGGGEVKLLEHAGAYGTLSQEGMKHEINPILKIEDKNGQTLYEYKDKTEQVINSEITRLTTSILSDNEARTYVFGAKNYLTLSDRPVAAKTGTTNDFRDAWTMGYTPSLVCGVWVGNNNNDAMKKGADGSQIAAPIWNQFMAEASKGTPVEKFTAPQPIVTGKPVLDGDTSGGQTVQIDTMSGKLATQYTPSSTLKEITVSAMHDILYYVNKDDPRGSAPSNPASDSQFENWEKAVQAWAVKQNIQSNTSTESVPTEYDNIHLAGDQPSLIIINPLDGQNVRESSLTVEVTASAKRGIKAMEFYIDDQLVATQNNTNDATLDLASFNSGRHVLKVLVKDDLENTATKKVTLNFSFANTNPAFKWTTTKTTFTASTSPIVLKGTLTNWQQAQKMDFYYLSATQTLEKYIVSINPKSATVTLNWDKKPAVGDYTIYANMFDVSNKKFKTPDLKITIK
ncbi:MAG: PBP1A family penicillin-binding protein [bacterium]